MKHYRKLTIITVALFLGSLIPQSAFAQSAFTARGGLSADRTSEARLALKIPFGPQTTSKTSAYDPRLSFGVNRYAPQTRGVQNWQMRGDGYAQSEISLSLSHEPILRLNGQEYNILMDEEYGLNKGTKTAGKVALVAGTVAVVVVAGLLIRVVACGSDGEDDKC